MLPFWGVAAVQDMVVLGLQWGDEGKGRVVDEAAADCRAVVRFQGGANAGHTVVVSGRRFALHQVPSGALQPGVVCVIGAGCAVDPWELRAEVRALEAAGCALPPGRLVVSGRAQVVLPFMRAIDAAEEALRPRPVGTTGRGIGPTYAAKAGRWGTTVAEFVEAPARVARSREIQPWIERWLAALQVPSLPSAEMEEVAAWLIPFVGDDLGAIAGARAKGRVLFEGQLGLMRDPDRGVFPFTTGASLLPAAALLTPGAVVLGVAKPYLTLVGGGHLPTEASPADAAALRAAGGEYGATTGRPRRCGWLDIPALRYASVAAGATALAVTKLDLIAGREGIPVCVEYADWDPAGGYPSARRLEEVRPVYTTWPTGDGALAFARRMAAAVGLPLAFAGTGPGRGEGFWL